MDQYKDSSPQVKPSQPITGNFSDQIHQLQKISQDQQAEIQDLRIELRRLKNELRVAVNSFNLKSHG